MMAETDILNFGAGDAVPGNVLLVPVVPLKIDYAQHSVDQSVRLTL